MWHASKWLVCAALILIMPVLVPLAARSAGHTISGYKFNDLDHDGAWDKPGESGLPGWTIELTYPGGSTVTTVTGAGGYYAFTGLPDGTYTVREIPQTGWIQSFPAAGFYTITLANTVPEVNAGPDATLAEGGTFTQGGSFTDPDPDDWTATVDYGDGSGTQPLALAGKTFNLSHVYLDDGVFTVTVTVTDDDGGVGSDTVIVTVTPLSSGSAPVVDAGPDAAVAEGQTFTQPGSFTDLDSSLWTATVDYGDSAGAQPLILTGQTFILSRTYHDNGLYTVTVQVTDDAGLTGTDTVQVTVGNTAPAVDLGPDATVEVNTPFTRAGSFTDPGTDTWLATVDYGDGAWTEPLALNGKGFTLSHTYTAAGTYTVHVDIVDDDGGMGYDELRVTVLDVMPMMDIVKDGAAVAVIVWQTTNDQSVANTLNAWIQKMTGVTLPLVTTAPTGPAIFIGQAAVTAGLDLNGIDSPSREGLRITCDGVSRLLLGGQDNNSTLKAACRLLETFGCRYLIDNVTGEVYPTTQNLSAGIIDITEKPGMFYRSIWGSSWSTSNLWKVWNGMGGPTLNMGHAWGQYIPTTTYDTHPEWFALRGGVRVRGDWYCTSNPELREAFAQAVIAKIASGVTHPSISPPDGRGYCECPVCVAQDDPTSIEPSSGTINKTNRYADFFDYVGRRVAEVYPNSIVSFYCYADYTQAPTSGIVLSPNLAAWIAPIRYCRLHHNGDPNCESRDQLEELLSDWSQSASKLGYRTYNFNLAEVLVPFSMQSIWEHDIPDLRNKGCVGFNVETLRNWQIYGPHIYESIRLAYDPDLDAGALMQDYFLQLYGPDAGPIMQRYWQDIDTAFQNLDSHAGSYYNLHLVYTPAFIDHLQGLLDAAFAAVAGNATRTARVQMYAEGLMNARQYTQLRDALNAGDMPTAGSTYDNLLARSEANAAAGALGQTYTVTYLKRFIGNQIAAARASTAAPSVLRSVMPDMMRFTYDPNNQGLALGYAQPEFDDSGWPQVQTYGMPLEAQGIPDQLTHQWFRCTFTADPQPGMKYLLLVIEVDRFGQVFVNGQDCGTGPTSRQPYEIDITAALQAGENTLAIHVDHTSLSELFLGGIIRPIYLIERPL